LYRGISDFKKGHLPRNNIAKNEKGDLVADSHSILSRQRNYFSQLLNVLGVNDAGQTEINTKERIVPEPSASEFTLVTGKLKSKKPPGFNQIPAEMIKARGKTICCDIHKLIIPILNKDELSEE
jgi:hypothetical protein